MNFHIIDHSILEPGDTVAAVNVLDHGSYLTQLRGDKPGLISPVFVNGTGQVDGASDMSFFKPEVPVKSGENCLKRAEKCRNFARFLGNPTI